MKKVFKYPVGAGVTEMPKGAQILTFQIQANELYLWALVDPEAPKQERRLHVVGTGHEVASGLEYIGTVQTYTNIRALKTDALAASEDDTNETDSSV